MDNSTITANPLCWPPSIKRTAPEDRQTARFKITFITARNQLFDEVRRLRGLRQTSSSYQPILSTNLPLKSNGLPYANSGRIDDPGVCVWFEWQGTMKAFPSDNYTTVTDNMWALKKSIEALRGIKRWGCGHLVEATFTGLASLPAPDKLDYGQYWWAEVLDIPSTAPAADIVAQYRRLRSLYYDPTGNDKEKNAKFLAIQDAYNYWKCNQKLRTKG